MRVLAQCFWVLGARVQRTGDHLALGHPNPSLGTTQWASNEPSTRAALMENRSYGWECQAKGHTHTLLSAYRQGQADGDKKQGQRPRRSHRATVGQGLEG